MSVGIWVREKTTLEHLVVGRFNTWHQMARSESNLFGLGMVVFWVAVQNKLSNLLEGIITMRPDLSNIIDIESVIFSISEWHDLDVPSP